MSSLPAEHHAYLEVLHRLSERSVAFTVTGSFALRLYMDALDGEPVPDCDLFLDPALDNLQRWAAALVEEGWALTVWGEPMSLPLDPNHLRGKYYVRAKKGALVIDGTYEQDTLSLEEILTRSSSIQGLRVMDLDTLLALKRARATPRDVEQVAQVERWRRASAQKQPPGATNSSAPRRGP
jgi:hypothetical protein